MSHIRSPQVVEGALAASRAGARDADVAREFGIAVKTLRRWRRDYLRRGMPRGQPHTSAPCPRCAGAALDRAAYAELFGWYLGDGTITDSGRGIYALHIYTDAAYPEANARIAEVLRRVKPGGRPHTRMRPNCVQTTMSWKHWPCLFPQHGPGRKHLRELGMAPWQWEIVEEFPAAFLRGLFHSDGSRSNNHVTRRRTDAVGATVTVRYDYPRWEFSNRSAEILGWCGDALDLAEVAWRRSSRWHLSVARRDAVQRLDALIGLKT